jgi:hypothetical protein
MEKHAYWAVICKTPGCSREIFLEHRYLGTIPPQESEKAEIEAPAWEDVPCRGCHTTHRYMQGDFEVRTRPYRF